MLASAPQAKRQTRMQLALALAMRSASVGALVVTFATREAGLAAITALVLGIFTPAMRARTSVPVLACAALACVVYTHSSGAPLHAPQQREAFFLPLALVLACVVALIATARPRERLMAGL